MADVVVLDVYDVKDLATEEEAQCMEVGACGVCSALPTSQRTGSVLSSLRVKGLFGGISY
jgi:hypothetical protein